jgi:integrase
MTSSIQIKKGNYYIVLSYRDKTGKRKTKWVSTHLPVKNNKYRANAMIPEVLEKYAYLETEEITSKTGVAKYALDWLNRKKNGIGQSTYERYQLTVEKHIAPWFAERRLNMRDVKPRHIVEFYNEKSSRGRKNGKGGLACATMKSMGGVLRTIFNSAVIDGTVNRNPALNIPIPVRENKGENNKYVFLNQEQANAVIKAFDGHELQPVVYMTLYYGLRKSEVLGLKWNSVDFDANTVKIRHTVVKNRSIIAKDSTKAQAGRRTFELLPEVKEMLLSLKANQEAEQRLFGDCYENKDGYVFVWEDGKLFRPDSVTRGFQRVLKNKGLPHMRFHDLRHSTASILYDIGWDVKRIQEWLGHADIETTANIYLHISNSRKCAMAKDLHGLFTAPFAGKG